MKKIFSLVYLVFIGSALLAQKGAPLLTHYKESREIENQSWAICQDVNRVMLFANRKGILSFDGEEWSTLRIPIIPYSMQKNPQNGNIYVGSDNDYGLLKKDNMGSYTYVSLSGDSSDLGVVTKIIFSDSLTWFYSEQTISCHNFKTNKLELRLKSKTGFPFTGMFITPKNTFINVLNKGLFRLESDTLFPIVTGYLTEKVDILFSLPYNQNMVLVGTGDGKLSLFDGIKYYGYKIKDDGYIRYNILSEGITMGDSLYAFSTLDGGVVVIEKYTGKIRFLINNQNELPDDEVFAIVIDNSGGLWISHQYGLTRADLNLPIGNFSIYPGLKGNLTSSVRHNNELYVATSEGVFYLTDVKNYSEVEVLVKNSPGISTSSPPVQEEKVQEKKVQEEKVQEQPGSRKNIFTRIFGKKIVPKNKETIQPSKEVTPPSKETIPTLAVIKIDTVKMIPFVGYTRKKVSKLKSINSIYKKVDGFNEKCRQLVSTKNGILAATNRGLFIINDHKARVIARNRYINSISWQPFDGKYSVATGDGYFLVSYHNGKWSTEIPDPDFTDPVYSVIQTEKNILWLGSDNIAYKTYLGSDTVAVKRVPFSIKNFFPQRYLLEMINDSVFLFTETGVHFYDNTTESFIPYKSILSFSPKVKRYSFPLSNIPLIGYDNDWIYTEKEKQINNRELSLFKIFDEIVSINTEKDYIWIIDGENRLFGINRNKSSKINPEIDLFVKNIYNDKGTSFSLSHIVFNRGDNIINFDIVAPSYVKGNTTQYQYFINKAMPGWSPWSTQTSYSKVIPRSGDYTLLIRAKDLWGNIGDPVSLKFTIRAPFVKTIFFYLLLALVGLLIFFLFVRFRERQLHEKNRILEEKVKERTTEIEAQKKEITSSIEYASRIQRAMLPMTELFKQSFSEFFIFFKPRDIVSGDFYWIGEDEKHVFLTVADCTGHGVPGAFMSTLGISALNEIITNNRDLQASTVLNLLREKIKNSLHQTGKEGEATDGMDISFCVLHKNKKSIQFSGAYSPLYIFTKGEFKEYKSDRMPIGIYYGNEVSFTNYEINIRKGDVIYIFSDGLTDQFGGPDGGKYKKSNLKKLLFDIYYLPLAEQKQIIENEFEKWKGNTDQVDDITIIGVRI